MLARIKLSLYNTKYKEPAAASMLYKSVEVATVRAVTKYVN